MEVACPSASVLAPATLPPASSSSLPSENGGHSSRGPARADGCVESKGPRDRPSEPHEASIRQDLGNAEAYDGEDDEAVDESKTYKPVYQGVACLHEIKGTRSVQGVCGQDCQ